MTDDDASGPGSESVVRSLRENPGDALKSTLAGVRFGKFVSVGVLGAICDVFVLVLLSEWFGVLPELATLAGIETAILVMFLVNERWTFASHGPDDRSSFFARLKRSHAVRAAGVTTQYLIFLVLYRGLYVSISLADLSVWQWVVDTIGIGIGLGSLDVWLLVAKGAGIGIGMLVNYVFESVFTWQVHLD